MTLRQIIDHLSELAEDHGDDTEVRLAQQPNWPFEYAVDEIVAVTNVDDDDDDDADTDAGAETVVYIGEGAQLGYLSGAATKALDWGRGRR
jgi:hypothetical protein